MVTLLLGDGNLKLEMLIQLIFDYLEAGRNISFTWSRRRFHHCNNGVKCIEHSPLTACTEKMFQHLNWRKIFWAKSESTLARIL